MEIKNQYVSDKCAIYQGDCVELIQSIPDESVGFSVFSPPFAELYTYSDELADMGNSKDYNEFFRAFDFLVEQLYRVLWSGRNIAVHVDAVEILPGKKPLLRMGEVRGKDPLKISLLIGFIKFFKTV